MTMIRWLIIAICMLQIMPAAARMYQWNDPATGTTQLSGTPPAWYRSGADGPRVFVFERGRLIDDTGVSVPEERRVYLRRQAFFRTEQDTRTARAKAEQAERMRALFERPAMLEMWEQVEATSESPALEQLPERSPEAEELADSMPPDEAEQLRSLLSAWEAQRARALRQMLSGGDDEAPAARETTPPETEAPPEEGGL